MNKQKHLNLESRITIETKLNEGESFKAIGRLLYKDCTTISKEVKNHISFEKSGSYGKAFNDCRLAFQHECFAQRVCQGCTSRKNGFAGLAANALLPVFSTKSMFARNFPNRLMSVMAAHNVINVPWRSVCTKLFMLKKSMNWLKGNPDPVLPSRKVGSDRSMILFRLF